MSEYWNVGSPCFCIVHLRTLSNVTTDIRAYVLLVRGSDKKLVKGHQVRYLIYVILELELDVVFLSNITAFPHSEGHSF